MAKESKKSAKNQPTEEVVKDKVAVSPLSGEELRHYQLLLLEKRAEIIGNVSSMESEALKKSRSDAGDLSNMPIHMADIGTDNYEQEFALGLLDSERKLLHEINDALVRIEDGGYGICEGTGEPIPKARLEAVPWARYSVKYAELIEKGLVREPEHESEVTEKKKRKGKKAKNEDVEDELEEEEVEEEAGEEEEEDEDDEDSKEEGGYEPFSDETEPEEDEDGRYY